MESKVFTKGGVSGRAEATASKKLHPILFPRWQTKYADNQADKGASFCLFMIQLGAQ